MDNKNNAFEDSADSLTAAARKSFGINYLFPYQRLVISNILEAGSPTEDADPPARQIVILPTGAGKSLCFMLPATMLSGPTLVIFPLLSLISDQLRRCEEAGIGAAKLTGGQSGKDREEAFSGIKAGRTKIVLTNPETALSPKVLPRLKGCGFQHLVFDEVHTVSEWGDSFRPAYLESRKIYTEAEIPIVTAFTATASEKILDRVKELLFPEEHPHIVSANPDRPNIAYTVLPSLCKINSLQHLLRHREADSPYPGSALYPGPAPHTPVTRPALVFCATRKAAEKTALQLRMRLNEGEIFFYHAGLTKEEKKRTEDWFFKSDGGILCATTAYGLGIDKPNIRTVIHRDLSPSVEAYLQESGRAGRDRAPAEAVLLLSPSDWHNSRQEPGSAAEERFMALLNFALNAEKCRRRSLMELLDAEPDTCFGCDVCRKAVETAAPYQDAAVRLIKHVKRCYSAPAAANQLYEMAAMTDKNDAAEIIEQLQTAGLIRRIQRGPWKGKLTV